MAGNRLWFAVQAAIFYPEKQYGAINPLPTNADTFGTTSGTTALPVGSGIAAHGVQDVSITTNFALTPVFELGQAAIYENTEGVPTVEIQVSKVIDGYPLLFQLATQGCSAPTLMARLAQGCTFQLGLWPDDVEFTAYQGSLKSNSLNCNSKLEDGQDQASTGSGTGTTGGVDNNPVDFTMPLSLITCPKCFVSNIQYSISTTESATESLTLSGSQKFWSRATGSGTEGKKAQFNINNNGVDTSSLDNTDEPLKHVAQGYHVQMHNAQAKITAGGARNGYNNDVDYSIWPKNIPGIAPNGINHIYDEREGIYCDEPSFARIQSVQISAQSERTDINMLGRKTAIYKSASSNVTVSTEIAVLSTIDDGISSSADEGNWCGVTASESYPIRIAICTGKQKSTDPDNGVRIYTGDKNNLTSVAFGQGGTGGGNVTTTYSYQTSNQLTVVASTMDSDNAVATPTSYMMQEHKWWIERASLQNGWLRNTP